MSTAPVLLRLAPPIAWITLALPQRGNACSAELVQALHDALDAVSQSDATSLVLRGDGRHFCTGFDLGSLDQETDDSLLARFIRLELVLQRIARAPQVTIAIAQGRAIGAGADLFAACDIRLACSDATFAFPGARGFAIVLGSRRLAQKVGNLTAADWIGSGATIDAARAATSGLATHLCADVESATALAESVARERGVASAVHGAIRAALEPSAADHDAHDLAQLVRSASRAGLRDRIARYAASRVEAGKKTSPP